MHNLSHCINFNLRCSHSIAIMFCLHYLGPLALHPAPRITSALHLLCPHRSPSEPTTGPRTWTFGWRKRLRRPWTGRTFEVWCWIASFRRRWAYSTMFISIFQKTTRWENTTSVKCLIYGVILRNDGYLTWIPYMWVLIYYTVPMNSIVPDSITIIHMCVR